MTKDCFYQNETNWTAFTSVDEFNGKHQLKLEKNIHIENSSTKQIVKALIISLFLSQGIAGMMRNFFEKKSLLERVFDFFTNKTKEYYLAELTPLVYFRVFFENVSINYGTAKVRLHTSSNETFEESMHYEYITENDPLIFQADDKMVAVRIFDAFISNRIKKVEFIPIEEGTFNRMYFDIIDDGCYALKDTINHFTEEQGFKIINYK